MGQMLVVKQVVQMADEGLVTHPSDALDSMRERFLMYGVRAPFAWITRLCTYGKKVQNTTTSLGYIYWSDDEQTLSYKELRLSKQWLMDRVLNADWLREEFLELYQFLERLLLLIHITAGQPRRATELLGLWHKNTVHGRHWSIYLEHRLVSTITAYHKGYSVSNSIKIIYCYLLKPVSELVVYYLWLVLPFWQAMAWLARRQSGPQSAFLWPCGDGTWDSSWLRTVLQREAEIHLQTKLNILSYRHTAIAISRVHLKCGGFKRDYGTDDAVFNEQASHSSWVAGTVYARGLQEAPGHVEARRQRYRAISREWHAFLGFETYLGPRKRSWEEGEVQPGLKRQRPYVMVEMDYD
ncbi:putative telomere-associated RecQ helicase [Aspergillus fumigatus Af293]|uniref:Telomere-associated RecQ helicase, putative n=1 Tax=Aspergillus fumigatus (strain ATCC MYA-4609 / CBS 101355 / FGSC A1100 / Af293) TaxID=330879 RepID=Q4WL60_ASPFU|nr:telomere-associated RecQ helicase, putative [Aspergillus fumigatus Af293]EAL89304.1 telomere-associated RecQ helicase, putative [Aspergillus fumigatus Af293]